MSFALGELAVRFGCELRGDPELRVAHVATLADAVSGDLGFLANPHYRPQLAATRATVVVTDAAHAALSPVAVLVSANPYATYARIAALLHPGPAIAAGVHSSAVIDPSARLAASASVGALAVIGPGALIGERARIGPGCLIGDGVAIGADCLLHAGVTVIAGATLGERVRIHPGVVIGSDGFGFAPDAGAWTKVPQLGSVRIGADVEIGANTTIDRGAIGDTVIEAGVKLDNQIQVAHNVYIGAHTVIAACVGISGSTRIGARCMIGGAVGIVGHLDICDDVVVTGMSMVSRSIGAPGIYSGGIPAEPAPLWRRLVGRFKRLEALAERVRRQERSNNRNPA
ncbi:MAG TPA: UDP-3-O-(3-hydroxymyristoyl)glucosamine N-acyltransferase [Steroidobacteraceae bacterium]|nr:UDP-3-O-(3-hydroxymyristoyl)glucosamine N-acyltransferase [Steroidobacteraceae bacterium]